MILMYHNLAESPGFNTLAVADFEDHLRYLRESGLEVLSLHEYVSKLGQEGSARRVAVTFDDGYVSFRELALPILQQYQIPASLFIPVDWVGKWNEWDVAQGHPRFEIMGWDELRELAGNPLVELGSHGFAHISMRQAGDQELEKEIVDSKRVMEEKLGKSVRYFSFPFGQMRNFDGRALGLLQKAGYKAAVSTIWSRHNAPGDKFSLHRIEMRGEDDLHSLKSIISRNFDPKFFKQNLKNTLFKLGILK